MTTAQLSWQVLKKKLVAYEISLVGSLVIMVIFFYNVLEKIVLKMIWSRIIWAWKVHWGWVISFSSPTICEGGKLPKDPGIFFFFFLPSSDGNNGHRFSKSTVKMWASRRKKFSKYVDSATFFKYNQWDSEFSTKPISSSLWKKIDSVWPGIFSSKKRRCMPYCCRMGERVKNVERDLTDDLPIDLVAQWEAFWMHSCAWGITGFICLPVWLYVSIWKINLPHRINEEPRR